MTRCKEKKQHHLLYILHFYIQKLEIYLYQHLTPKGQQFINTVYKQI